MTLNVLIFSVVKKGTLIDNINDTIHFQCIAIYVSHVQIVWC